MFPQNCFSRPISPPPLPTHTRQKTTYLGDELSQVEVVFFTCRRRSLSCSLSTECCCLTSTLWLVLMARYSVSELGTWILAGGNNNIQHACKHAHTQCIHVSVNQSISHSITHTHTWVGVKNFGFTEEQKNIVQGSIKLKELHVCIMRVQKKMAAWRSEVP